MKRLGMLTAAALALAGCSGQRSATSPDSAAVQEASPRELERAATSLNPPPQIMSATVSGPAGNKTMVVRVRDTGVEHGEQLFVAVEADRDVGAAGDWAAVSRFGVARIALPDVRRVRAVVRDSTSMVRSRWIAVR